MFTTVLLAPGTEKQLHTERTNEWKFRVIISTSAPNPKGKLFKET